MEPPQEWPNEYHPSVEMSTNSVVMTVSGRCEYLQPTLQSWCQVEGIRDWNWIFGVEPNCDVSQVEGIILEFARDRVFTYQIQVHDEQKGVLENPFWCLDKGFSLSDYVVLAEEDLVVASDILVYHDWACEKFRYTPEILTVNSYTYDDGPDNEVELVCGFSPWIWGTWKDRWESVLRLTWDHNYSTYTDVPNNESGWDWNINKRIMPSNGFLAAFPRASRVQNIGKVGAHAQAHHFNSTQVPFSPIKSPQSYTVVS